MLFVAIVASLLASAGNAVSSVLERLATARPEAHKLFSREQAFRNSFNKLFLWGLAIQILAAVIQAVALSRAPLIVVEPLMTTDLLFLLLIIHFRFSVPVGPKEWLAAGSMIVGISGLFLAAQPQGGHMRYAFAPWLLAIIAAVLVIVAALAAVKAVNAPRQRAACAAIAAAISFAMNAGFTKLALNQWHAHGVVYVFQSWPIYALIVSGLISIYLMQLAFGSGPLAVAQPIIEVVEPTISVVIGMAIFGDRVRLGALILAVELLAAGLVVLGIVALASSPKVQQAGKQGI